MNHTHHGKPMMMHTRLEESVTYLIVLYIDNAFRGTAAGQKYNSFNNLSDKS